MGGQGSESGIEPVNAGDFYVDLGLPSGLLWATCNIGADTPEGYGLYFSWGDVTGYAEGSGHDFSQANYNATTVNGTFIKDISTDIQPNSGYDAARVNCGESWRMPTITEIRELYDNTSKAWVSNYNATGVKGYKFMKKSDSSVYIFIPACGCYDGTSLDQEGVYGFYWSSICYIVSQGSSDLPYYMLLSSSGASQGNMPRRYGFTVRPVTSILPTKVIFKVTTTDGSSVEGVELTISNQSKSYTVTTDATGRVALAGLSGAYTITSDTHDLNISSFTANGNMTVNISAALKAIQYTQVIIDQTKSDPAQMITLQTIDGQADAEAGINAIRSDSHRYVGTFANNVMSIKQLDDNNGTLYADGTSAATDIATIGKDVWMRLPKFWWKCETVATDKFRVTVAYGRKPSGSEWKEWSDQQLVAVFRSYVSSNKLYSSSAKTPTDKVGKANSVAYAGARGAGFHLVTWEWHCIMALLYYVKYRNTNCKSRLGGGAQYAHITTGVTNQLGMADGVSTDSSGNRHVNFWGLECWGHGGYEFLHNVTVSSSRVCTLTDISGNTVRTIGTYVENSNTYVTKMLFGTYFDCLPQASGGSNTTGYCCRMLAQSAAGMLMRSDNIDNQFFVAALSHRSDNTSSGGRLSRLAFTGKVVVVE
jgi:hypothetical protein